MKIKMVDIARELNISVAAVSMALNEKKGVSEETREKILEIAALKGYKKRITKPNKQAKKHIKLLRVKKHGLVAVDSAFFSQVIDGIEEESKKNNCELLISNCHISEINIEWINKEMTNDISGIIILATELELNDVGIFDIINKPFVILDSYFPSKEWNSVLINNSNASYQAVEYFKECGHQTIGYLKSKVSIYNFNERFKSYFESLTHFDITYNEQYTYLLTPTIEGAYEDMKELLKDNTNNRPTAFLADNDIIAVGAIKALRDQGTRIPEDISIIGIDDMPFSQAINPALTTSRVYKREIGKESVRILMSVIKNKESITKKIAVNTHIVIRNSVKNMIGGGYKND